MNRIKLDGEILGHVAAYTYGENQNGEPIAELVCTVAYQETPSLGVASVVIEHGHTAADNIRVRWDDKNYAWIIERQTIDSWEADDHKCDCGWRQEALIAGRLPDAEYPPQPGNQ